LYLDETAAGVDVARVAEDCDFATLLDKEAVNMTLSGSTQDHRNAALALVEKKPPTFKGI